MRVSEIIASTGLLPPYPPGDYLTLGRAVDQGCQLIFKGHDLGDLEVDARIYPYLVSLVKWIDKTRFEAVRVQAEWVHPNWKIVGHPDADDEELLIDTKIGVPAKHYKLQTAAYFEIGKALRIPLKRRGCLYLQEDESTAKLDLHDDRTDWFAFLSAWRAIEVEAEAEKYRENVRRWKER